MKILQNTNHEPKFPDNLITHSLVNSMIFSPVTAKYGTVPGCCKSPTLSNLGPITLCHNYNKGIYFLQFVLDLKVATALLSAMLRRRCVYTILLISSQLLTVYITKQNRVNIKEFTVRLFFFVFFWSVQLPCLIGSNLR